MTKMTNRDFYTMVVNGTMNDDVKEFAQAALSKMDARNAARASKPSKKATENEPIKAAIIEFITVRDEYCIAAAIAEAVDISTSKASSLCGQLVTDGKLVVKDVKVPKVGKRKAYAMAGE